MFLGLIEYELNSLSGASHLVDYISVQQRSLWVSYAQQNFAQVGKNRNEVKETWLLWP